MQSLVQYQIEDLHCCEHDMGEVCRQWLATEPLFLDTETTGLDSRAEIVELAVVNAQGEVLIDTLVKPCRTIPQEVTNIHGITNKMVKNAPDWHDIYQKVSSILCGRNVITYNASFDARMIGQNCLHYRLPLISANYFCAMEMYKRHTYNHKWIKLNEAARECGVELPEERHRALADTLMCLGIVQEVGRGVPANNYINSS